MTQAMRQLRWLAAVIAATLIGVFILQNSARLELHLFQWVITTRRAVLVFVCVGIGFLVGWMFGYVARGQKR